MVPVVRRPITHSHRTGLTNRLHSPCFLRRSRVSRLESYYDDKWPRYGIIVKDEKEKPEATFRTKRLILDIGTDTMRGRRACVWEVIKLNARGEGTRGDTYALDVWVADDLERGDIVLDDNQKTVAASFRDAIDRFYLTTLAFGNDSLDGKVARLAIGKC